MRLSAVDADGVPEHGGARQHVRLHTLHDCTTAAAFTAAAAAAPTAAAAVTATAAGTTAAAADAAEASSGSQAAGRLWCSCGGQSDWHHAAAPIRCPSPGTHPVVSSPQACT